MSAAGQSLFVYYKVALAERAARRAQLDWLQQAVAKQWPDVQCEAMQRPDASADGLETWMEVYRHPDGLTQGHLDSIADLAARSGLPAKRAVESFVALRD